MSDKSEEHQSSIMEVRRAREQAEVLRDQLQAEYQRIQDERDIFGSGIHQEEKFRQGREAMRKAITAANHAIASIDQALREMERASDN